MSNLLEKIKRDIRSVWEQLKAKQQEINWKRVVVRNLPYGAFSYVCNKLAWFYHQSEQEVVLQKVLETINQIEQAFDFPLLSFAQEDIFIGVIGGITLKLVVIYKINHAKKFRPGREYGSARWGTAQDMKPYTDSVFEQNIILTATEYLTIQAYLIHPKFARNKNILVIGGSGSGKTRFFVKPNLMQMHSSYVITDPNG